MVTETGPEVAEGNPTTQAGTQNKDVTTDGLEGIASKYCDWNQKEDMKVENPYIKLFGDYPFAKAMATAEHANVLNSSNFPELYSPVLFGSVSLRPFRGMKEKNMESEEDSTREDEGKGCKRRKKDAAGKILILEGLKKYTIGDDPIKFVQAFLRAIYNYPTSSTKESIHKTFLNSLDYTTVQSFKNLQSKDPDLVIEQFIIKRSSWSHLARNVIEVQEHIKWYYDYSSIIREANFFMESCDWMLAHPKIRPLRLLTILSPTRAKVFDTDYESEKYNSEFDVETVIKRFVDREVGVRYKWLMLKDYDFKLIKEFNEIREDKLLQSNNQRDYINVRLEDLVKLVKDRETKPKENVSVNQEQDTDNKAKVPKESSI